MEPLSSAVVLGFVLGVQHATDPDHLTAVATIVTRERRFADGALIGALWGLGHMLTLATVGTILIAFTITMRPSVATGLELLVAAMLVILGVLRLRDAARGMSGVEAAHLTADHDHGGAEVVHSHAHAHGDRVHGHPHVHPSRDLTDQPWLWTFGRLKPGVEPAQARSELAALTAGEVRLASLTSNETLST